MVKQKISQKLFLFVFSLTIIITGVTGTVILVLKKGTSPQPSQTYESDKKNLLKLIDQANYCQKDEDCLLTYFNCPFGTVKQNSISVR